MRPNTIQPILIIGAPRSGTNMLRNILTKLRDTSTWPCDEINYIWRFGNAAYPNDELHSKHARPNVQRYIRNEFKRLAAATGSTNIVEKTCANSLRIPFVNKILPRAKYIFLLRNGHDVVQSAIKRWQAPLELQYLLEKAWFVPARDLPYYALRYMKHRLNKVYSKDSSLPLWGPVFEELAGLRQTHQLQDVVAMQWVKSVQLADRGLKKLPNDSVLTCRYEEITEKPLEQLSKVTDFLGLRTSPLELQQSVSDVRHAKATTTSNSESLNLSSDIKPLFSELLHNLGYDDPRYHETKPTPIAA